VFGAVSIQSDEEYAFDDSHERQLNTLAAYIAIKIRNNELLLDTKQAASELGFLFNMTRAAVQTTDLDDALANVANIIQYELDGAETATIYLREHDPVEGEMAMVPHASSGFASDVVRTMSLGEGLVGRSADGQEPIILQDARFEGGGTTADMRAMLVVPLVAGREVIGVISVGSTQVGVFDETDVALLQTASSTLTAVIQNAQLLEQIEATNEELRQLDQLKTQFLANMSHELRTPLNSIIGFSKVILNEIDGPLTDLQRQDLSTIHESGKHLLGLINDILDMSKIEAGKMEVHNEFMEMEDIIKGVMSTSLALVKDKPVALRDDLPSQLPVVYADSKRVRQVLLNLMSNAAKFTHEGTITLKVREYNSDPDHDMPGPHIRISVVDTGIGISEHDMPLLFEAFRQVDGSTTRQVGGTGLGLPITKEFIELMGGRIWVESEVGSGSAFNFTLPVQPPTGVETTPTGQLIDRSKPIILAVDDEPRVLDLYRRYLDNDEYSMVGVPSAQNIVERVRNVRPTLIIMDLALPGKDGWEALDEIKQEPDISHIPVIICSIHDERTRGMEAGAAGYLTKPVIEEDLLGMVDDVLEGMDLDQQTVATTMHEPVYDASEREAVKMAEAIAEERDATLEDADPVTADAEPAIAGDAHPEAEADDLDEVAQALPPDPPAGPSPVPSGPTSAPAVPREGEAIRTLIIDPDEAYAAALSDLLEETEMFDTHVTHKGFSGLGAADQNRPHVIILDVDIDDMDGLGLLAAMRSNPSTNNVPVIILTERDLTQEQLEPFADGITAYVNKLDHDADSLLMEIDEVVAILLYGFE
jgi:signal transduction histidine kinase/CheY-like chemotaxis protein